MPLNSAGANPPPPSSDATRITPPATVQGSVNAQGKVRYVLAITQGQTLTVKLTGPANELGLAVYTANNTALLPQSTTLTWSQVISANGDYFIEVIAIQGASSKAYTLDVGLVNPTSQVERVADINNGAGDSSPAYLEEFSGALFFRADGGDGAGVEEMSAT